MALMTYDEYFKKYNGVGIDYDGKWSYQCFTKDHYVLMADMTYKAIQDIEIGDKVIGYDNKVNTVIQTHKRKADVIKVRTDLGDIVVTENHPFYYKDGSFDSILKGSKKPFGIFDYTNYEESGLTDNELRFLGFWLGDGSLVRHHDNRKPEIRITYGDAKKDFVNSLEMITNVQPHTSGNGSFNASIRKREHPILTQIIYQCYNGKKEKVLPLIFNNREYNLVIEGYLRADGCEKNNSYTVSSTSKSLLLSIQAAAILCGYSTKSIRPFTRNGNSIVIKGKTIQNVKPIWRMTITKESKGVHKQINNVKYLGEETVYNIATDGTHTYICDNYKVHNCFDLANDYCVKVLGGKAFIGMYAWEIYENFNNQPSKNLFTRIANTPEFVPQKGDIIVWAKSLNGKAGHVAICDGVGDTTYFYSYEENWDGMNHPTERVRHNYNHVLGVLRPKDQTQIIGKRATTTDNSTKTKSTTLKGIDISRYQGKPDFSKVKNDVDYVILQVGYGRYVNQKDSEFERNYSECKKYGIPVGVYHFSYAKSIAEAQAEANACLEMIKGKQFEYPIYYDLEVGLDSLGKSLVSSIATTFCTALEKAGYYTGIYISRSPAQLYLTKEVAQRYALWLAEYNSKCNYNGDYGMWQYSSTGRISGINGDVDMDYCYVDYPTIIKNAGLNGYKKPEPTPQPAPTPEKKELDTSGYKEGDKGYQALALKTLLKLAIDKGIVSGKLDDTTGLGGGSIKVVNKLLDKWGYKQNGIAGENFINKIYKELK